MSPVPFACLRAGAVRLCLALCLALLVVPGYVVAPVLFSSLESVTTAGMLAGRIFHTANLGILILAFAVATFWLRQHGEQRPGRINWALLFGLMLFVAVNEFGVSAYLAALKTEHGPLSELAASHPARREFSAWHGASAAIHLIETLIAALLVALGGRRHGGGACRAS